MKKIKLYIACSLNGKIAEKDGSVDWLYVYNSEDEKDYGYEEFYKSIDTTIQGSSTYNQIIDWDIEFPYKDKTNYVITRNQDAQDNENVSFIKDNHIEFLKDLKEQDGGDIWLVGGGQINTMLLNEGLIDELQVFVMPIILSDGIDLFEGIPKRTDLKLIGAQNHSTGAVEMKYEIVKTAK